MIVKLIDGCPMNAKCLSVALYVTSGKEILLEWHPLPKVEATLVVMPLYSEFSPIGFDMQLMALSLWHFVLEAHNAQRLKFFSYLSIHTSSILRQTFVSNMYEEAPPPIFLNTWWTWWTSCQTHFQRKVYNRMNVTDALVNCWCWW